MNNAIYRQHSGKLTFCTPKTEKDCKKLILRKKFSFQKLHTHAKNVLHFGLLNKSETKLKFLA